jgi:hypothetical protein
VLLSIVQDAFIDCQGGEYPDEREVAVLGKVVAEGCDVGDEGVDVAASQARLCAIEAYEVLY